ncbi:maleylpyruvate isomerase family mycothiol-dependent enzyme [Kitasatospora sp. NPDC097643]|uniref:maleylpyruvate isomerase family mycothiol-dependent enzyme n=1 Tax=Kitasatospora sp. NPDC097643 TaxID=3157230 RepID=UPI00332A4F29
MPDATAPAAAPAPAADTAIDPAGFARLLDGVRRSAECLLATVGTLTDRQAREPSALPGWSRGHVLTHLARSADVYRWLLTVARTGVEPGPRADADALERALREGAGRGAAELVADLRGSLALLLDEATALPADRRATLVTALAGWRHPAWFTLHRCWRELETHHADLNLGYGTADWPADYLGWALDDTVAALAARAFPLARIEAQDLGRVWLPAPTGPAAPAGDAPTVTGPAHLLLAWLAGRGRDARLRSDQPLPAPPQWPLPPAPGWG